jgi:hypothetical protein
MASISIAWLLWQSLAAPTPVQILAASDDVALLDKARALRAEMAQSDQLAVDTDIGIASLSPQSMLRDLDDAQALVDEGQRHFDAMEFGTALDCLARGQTVLVAHTDLARASRLLALLMRIRGRVYLANHQAETAEEQFACAARLDPDFVPPADEWPPPSRLAYSDAVIAARRRAPVSLSVRVRPDHARLYLDGSPVGLGATTLAAIQPGLHVLLASGIGLVTVGTLVRAAPGEPLAEISLFAENLPAAQAHQQAFNALAASDVEKNDVTLRQALAVLAPARLLRVSANATGGFFARWLLPAPNSSPVSVALTDMHEAAAVLIGALSSPAAVPGPKEAKPGILAAVPWYAWTLGGVLAAGLATGGVLWATHRSSDRVNLVIPGRP